MRTRTNSRALLSCLLFGSVASASAYAGCTDEPAAIEAGDAGNDAEQADVAPVDSGSDVDAEPPCLDEPFDCSATAGDAGDGGGNGMGSVAEQAVPYELRCTPLYSCWSTKRVAADYREYNPAFTLYSDGADKTRWLHLPPGTKIGTSPASGGAVDGATIDEWVFPVGTAVFKEFRFGEKRIETRRLFKASETEWVFSVWKWSEDQSSATLMNFGATVPNLAHPGKMYEIPDTNACATCHDGHTDKLLSVDAWGLGGPGATGVTLATLKAEDRLSAWPYPTSLAAPEDSTGKFGVASGWYYNNCGFCHKPGRPGAASGMLLHLPITAALPGALPDAGGGLPDGGAGLPFDRTPIYLTAVDKAHNNFPGNFPPGTFMRIKSGEPQNSVVVVRDSTRDPAGGIAPIQMPPTLQRTFDDAGVAATTAWITALP